VRSFERGGGTSFEAIEPGIYAATRDGKRSHVAVNVTNPRVSNPNRTSLSGVTGSSLVAEEDGQTPTWWQGELWMFLLGVVSLLILVEWWTYHRRLTV
jgi:hypothetical protein